MNVYLLTCEWVGTEDVHGIFRDRSDAEAYVVELVLNKTAPGPGYYNETYDAKQFRIEEYELR